MRSVFAPAARAVRAAAAPAAVAAAVPAAAAALLAAAPAAAHAASWDVRAPGGGPRATLTDAGRELTLTVRRGGAVVTRARLGDAPKRRRTRVARSRVADSFSTPAGKRREHRLRARRLRVRFRGGRAVEVLAAPDGIAFRVTRPGNPEQTTFETGRAWLQHYRADYENPYREYAQAPRGRYGFPVLLQAGAGNWALLTEAGLGRDDAGSHLEADRPGRLGVVISSGERTPRRTPWRVVVTGTLADVVETDLPLALARPARIRDFSWVRPGRAAWSWWSDRGSASSSPAQREFVDLAAASTWEYSTVDEGWVARDVPSIAEYAAERSVRLLLWFDWRDLATEDQRQAALARVRAAGASGVKVDFLLSDDADRLKVYEDVARVAAQHKLVVAFHGSTAPRGLQRTWPNVLTSEGVLGAEHASADPMDPAHNVNLVFTRNVLGSMDYTPVTFTAPGRVTSDGHELAQSVVYESGLQHFADTPAAYRDRPAALDVLTAVPVAWDDTRLLDGRPGRFALLARRSAREWWVGALLAGPTTAIRVPLGFLGPGRFVARVTADDDGALATTERIVTARSRLFVNTAANGGFVIRLTPVP